MSSPLASPASRRGFLLVVLAALCWGTSGVSGQIVTDRTDLGPLDIAWHRMTIAAVALLVGFLVSRRRSGPTPIDVSRGTAVRLLLVGGQEPAGRDAHSQGLEESRRDQVHHGIVGGVAEHDAGFSSLVAGHGPEAPALRPPVVEVLRRHVEARPGRRRVLVDDRDQPIRALDRERPEDDGIDHREDRRRGAYAQGQRGRGADREGWMPEQAAERVAEVLD